MDGQLSDILLTRSQIGRRVRQLARQIGRDHRQAGELIIVPILNGSIIFLADLVRYLPLKLRIGMLTVSSYPGTSVQSRGARITRALTTRITGRHVLVLDDILDSGHTLSLVCRTLQKKGPASLKTCVLLRKPTQQARDFPVDYVGFDIPDEFVIGYGLDYDDYYRNLPDIAVLKQAPVSHA